MSPGNHSDSTYFKCLHEKIQNENIRYIVADKGYDSDAIRNCIEAFGQKPVISYRKNRKNRKDINSLQYRTRNLIERIVGRIKEFRRVATRYDKLDSRFLSFIACAFIQQIIC